MQDPSQNMNPPPVLMHHGQPPHAMVSQPQLLSGQPPHAMVSQPQLLSGQPPHALVSQPQLLSGQPQGMNPPPQLLGHPQHTQMIGQNLMMNRGYMPWPQQGQQLPPMNPNKFHGPMNPGFGASIAGRSNWKGRNVNDKRQGPRKVQSTASTSMGGYNPPSLRDLQSQNRQQARKYYPKKKFHNRFAPYAPRNTTSFLIRAKKSGGIASLVSPCPVTPTVLPTPVFSPSREVLVDMAKEEWGVDGYGSMKGLIRLRGEFENRDNEDDDVDEHDHEEENDSSESDVEEDNNVLSRLDHEMSRFEMVYPTHGVDYNLVLENRVHDQDAHISQLEEENLTLKESLFLMEREVEDLRRRLQVQERRNRVSEDVHEEVVENVSECESEGGSYVNGMGGVESKEELMEDLASLNAEVDSDVKEAKPDTLAEEQGNSLRVEDIKISD